MVLGIVLGLVQYARLQSTDRELAEEHRRLIKEYGILPVDNPDRFSLRRVTEEESAHFVWRCYVPPDRSLILSQQNLGGSGQLSCGHSNDHGIIRMRIGRRESGIRIYSAASGGSVSGSFAYPDELAEFLFEHWQELDLQVAGDDLLDTELDEMVTLVSVRVPEALRQRAVAEIPNAESHQIDQRLSEPVLTLRVGSEEAFRSQKK